MSFHILYFLVVVVVVVVVVVFFSVVGLSNFFFDLFKKSIRSFVGSFVHSSSRSRVRIGLETKKRKRVRCIITVCKRVFVCVCFWVVSTYFSTKIGSKLGSSEQKVCFSFLRRKNLTNTSKNFYQKWSFNRKSFSPPISIGTCLFYKIALRHLLLANIFHFRSNM